MKWWGKVVGGALGFVTAGPVGAMIGLVLGHQYDIGLGAGAARSSAADMGAGYVNDDASHEAFFKACFSIMGHVAKADGRVSESEIRAARSAMYRMSLTPEQVTEAIRLFNLGKSKEFPLDAVLDGFEHDCRDRDDLFRAFLEMQVHAALADGKMHHRARGLLWKLSQRLGISRVELAQMEALARAQYTFSRNRARKKASSNTVALAYKVLGVTKDASDKEITTAYRRLMNQYHPDKFVAKGLPESMMTVAKEKTREIRSAYDTLKAARGIR